MLLIERLFSASPKEPKKTCFQWCSNLDKQISALRKMTRLSVVLFVHVIFCVLINKSAGFVSQLLGNYLTDGEYQNQSFCETKVCMLDAGRLIYSASHDSSSIDPCNDFKTFAMGEFFKYRVPNARYTSTSFLNDVKLQYQEKQKRNLKKPIQPNEPKYFKVTKNFFQKCINSRNLEKIQDFNCY